MSAPVSPYVPFYVGGFKDLPDNTTPPTAEFLNYIEGYLADATGGLSNPGNIGYDVILIAGQSNSVSHGTGPTDPVYLDPPDPRIKQWGGCNPYLDQLITAIDPLYYHENRLGTVGHVMEFARNYVKTIPPNRTVLLVPTGHSSTGFTTSSLASPPVGYTHADGGSWDTTGGSGGISLYEFAIAQANQAMAQGADPTQNRFVAFLWLQGEADSGVSQATYAADLDALIAGFRTRITGAATAPFLLGQMLPQHIAAHSDFQTINAAHLDTPRRNTRCAFYYGPVGTQYANSTADTELHYNNAGQRLLGDSAWSVYPLALANVVGAAPVPPAAVTATQSGTSVVATVTRSAGRVTDYSVQYRVNGGSWTTFSHTATLDVTFTLTGFTLGNAVDVQIATVNERGTSAYVPAVTVTLVHTPNAPTLGTAAHTATSISPTWTPAGSGDPATSFLVEAAPHPAGGVYTSSVTVAAPATTGQITGLEVDQSYDYRVTPINAAGSGTAVTGTVSTDPVGFLMTDIGVSAWRALGMRKLVTGYAGNCIKVRRSSDNTTQNIGFTGTGGLDISSLLTFVGAGDGFIDTWYDQSGSARDMAQSTTANQPKIVASGVLITRNGKPAISFDGSTQWLDSATTGLYAAGAATILTACELDASAVAANNLIVEGNNGGGQPAVYTLTRCPTGGTIGGQIIPDVGSGGTVTLTNASIAINTGLVVQFSRVDTGTQDACWVSGVSAKSLTSYTRPGTSVTLNRARVGGLVKSTGSASMWQGTASEIVTFTSALTDPQRTAGETNQKSYYSIA